MISTHFDRLVVRSVVIQCVNVASGCPKPVISRSSFSEHLSSAAKWPGVDFCLCPTSSRDIGLVGNPVPQLLLVGKGTRGPVYPLRQL